MENNLTGRKLEVCDDVKMAPTLHYLIGKINEKFGNYSQIVDEMELVGHMIKNTKSPDKVALNDIKDRPDMDIIEQLMNIDQKFIDLNIRGEKAIKKLTSLI